MKKVLIGVAAVVAVVVVAAIALPYIVPTGPVRDRIVAEVAAATGREMRIDGPVRLSVLPSLSLIHISEPTRPSKSSRMPSSA